MYLTPNRKSFRALGEGGADGRGRSQHGTASTASSPTGASMRANQSITRNNESARYIPYCSWYRIVISFTFMVLFGTSFYVYLSIGSHMRIDPLTGIIEAWEYKPHYDLTEDNSGLFAIQWMMVQARGIKANNRYRGDLLSATTLNEGGGIYSYHVQHHVSKHDVINSDPFSLSTGINVWDWYPPELVCPDSVRVGKVGEGGKWVCGLSYLSSLRRPGEQELASTSHRMQLANVMAESGAGSAGTPATPTSYSNYRSPSTTPLAIQRGEAPCIMYSFGISTDVSFEVEILLRTACEIYAFDPTIGQLPFHTLPPILQERLSEQPQLFDQLKRRIHFHKVAMSRHSGASEMHSLNENLFDAMHRLGHSFVDVLKVDIEGGEWAVFRDLFNSSNSRNSCSSSDSERSSSANSYSTSNRNNSDEDSSSSSSSKPSYEAFPSECPKTGSTHLALPVGQLLIELHYTPSTTMSDVYAFFAGASAHGLHVFSREINLQPSIAGGLPMAVEYSLINAETFFCQSQPIYARDCSITGCSRSTSFTLPTLPTV